MKVVRTWVWLAFVLTVCLVGSTIVRGQAAPPAPAGQKPLLSEQAFKNVRVLRGIPVKEFMDTMGFFAASLSLNCSDCHSQASASSWPNYADDTPLKQATLRMILMVNAINRANFNGEPNVTCYTCHRGSQRPKAIPSLAQHRIPRVEVYFQEGIAAGIVWARNFRYRRKPAEHLGGSTR